MQNPVLKSRDGLEFLRAHQVKNSSLDRGVGVLTKIKAVGAIETLEQQADLDVDEIDRLLRQTNRGRG